MIEDIITAIFNLLINFANVITAPISALLIGLFPDITNIMEVILNLFDMVTDVIGWFAYLIPPKTKFAMLSLISFYIVMRPVIYVTGQMSKTLDLIKRINPFTGK